MQHMSFETQLRFKVMHIELGCVTRSHQCAFPNAYSMCVPTEQCSTYSAVVVVRTQIVQWFADVKTGWSSGRFGTACSARDMYVSCGPRTTAWYLVTCDHG